MVPFPIICFFLPEVSVIVANSLHRLAPADRVIKEEQMRIRYAHPLGRAASTPALSLTVAHARAAPTNKCRRRTSAMSCRRWASS